MGSHRSCTREQHPRHRRQIRTAACFLPLSQSVSGAHDAVVKGAHEAVDVVKHEFRPGIVCVDGGKEKLTFSKPLIQLEDTRGRFLSSTFAIVAQACPLVGVFGERDLGQEQDALELPVRRALWIWQGSVLGECHYPLVVRQPPTVKNVDFVPPPSFTEAQLQPWSRHPESISSIVPTIPSLSPASPALTRFLNGCHAGV